VPTRTAATEWICEQLRADPGIQSLRLREMAAELGYEGGKTIFDDYVREVRPRFLIRRTFQRTIYRPESSCNATYGSPGDRSSGPWVCVAGRLAAPNAR
jgi:hypothetical protein